jgi:hypothetical protein
LVLQSRLDGHLLDLLLHVQDFLSVLGLLVLVALFVLLLQRLDLLQEGLFVLFEIEADVLETHPVLRLLIELRLLRC